MNAIADAKRRIDEANNLIDSIKGALARPENYAFHRSLEANLKSLQNMRARHKRALRELREPSHSR